MAYTERYANIMEAAIMDQVAAGDVERVLIRIPGNWGQGVSSARALALLTHWDDREKSAFEIADETRARLADLPGVQVRVMTPGGLGVRGGDTPISVVLGGGSYETLERRRNELVAWMEDHPMFVGPDSDYEERQPQMRIQVDRSRAAALGVSLTSIGRTLETMLGSRVVTTFQQEGEEYDVLLQAEEADRATPSDLFNIYVRSDTSGELVSLGNLVTLTEEAGPKELNRFDRLRAISVTSGLAESVSLGQGLAEIEAYIAENMPDDVQLNYDGESREFKESGRSLYFTFIIALLVVYLVLAAQFESFRHPLIIMFTVPLAITGALAGMWAWGVSINVFSQIGMILLIGLAAKNGVLIVEFANQLRDRGGEFYASVVHAAGVRLRPVLMTSFASAFGALPLMLAQGAGSESRQAIGVTIFFGVMFSTLLTLFVVPGAYALIARGTTSPDHIARQVERMRNGDAAE